jgi:recombination protein RecA
MTKENDTKTASAKVADKNTERNRAIDLAVSYLEKQFGKGSVMRLGQRTGMVIDVIPTGSLSVDMAIGVGGLPKGRIIEIYGPESSGKTTFALSVVAQCQKAGGNCAFVDAEHALDPVYAKKIGVNIDNLLISQPDNGEQALEIADTLVRSGGIDVVIIDSVAALVPKQELEGDMDQMSVGLQARLMSKALRKITGSISKTGCMVIFINQIRMKIGGYGNPETTTGGNALKFYASVRMEIRKGKTILKGDAQIGCETSVKIVKNKVAPPFKKVELEMIFGKGISHESELVSLGEKCGVLEKSGSWYSYNGERIGQGKENIKQYLIDNPKIAKDIEEKIRSSSGSLGFDDSSADVVD